MAEKFYEQAKIAFQKISPNPGEIIAVTFPEDMSYTQIQTTVAYLQQLADEHQCGVMLLTQGTQIEILSDNQMAELGWQRVPKNRILQ